MPSEETNRELVSSAIEDCLLDQITKGFENQIQKCKLDLRVTRLFLIFLKYEHRMIMAEI